MSCNWPIVRLSDLVSIRHGFAFKGEFFSDVPTSDILVTPGNFAIGGGFKSDKMKYYSGPVPEDYILKPDDLLVTMTDLSKQADTLGFSALVPYHPTDRYLHNQRVGLVGFKGSELDKLYLYFLLRSREYRHHVVSSATGSTVKHTSPSKIASFEFRLPPLAIQMAIGGALKGLENKAQLNQQTNQTLEQMAQAIFKSWFVDFEPVKAKIAALEAGGSEDDALLAAMQAIAGSALFATDVADADAQTQLARLQTEHPKQYATLRATAELFPAAMQDSELGEIPEGWEVKGLGEFTSTFDYVANGSFAALKANVELFDQPNDVLYVRTTDFNKGFKSELKYTDKSSYQFLAKSKLFGHETIISNVGDVGTVFRAPSWYDMPMTLGSNAMGIVAEGANSYIYYLFKSPLGQHLLDGITSGSAQMKFNKTSFRKLRVVLPNSVLLIKFEEFEASLWTKHASNQKESLHLENLRDTLLPKLLSGEIDVSALADNTEVNA